eukprot:CAMPEP_0181428346 /NCGR_PEP_ID=MMETSP1110-20121109/16632_1 /TAXON_ID=174948 /ORGANISM="Symbiodinium sp., Strain CCMP421" /LENGTH=537 /DNA_ID=CAMNT_0023551571 /DNA_START=32 /DNA_END=1645 /DNA_ORIENTATION=-
MAAASLVALVDGIDMKSSIVCGEVNESKGQCDSEIMTSRDPTGGETPETGTPLTRSLSPSSDGGASAADRSERAASRRVNRRKKTGSAESAASGAPATDVPSASAPKTESLEERADSYQADVLRSSSDTEASSIRGRNSYRSAGGPRPKTAARPIVGLFQAYAPFRVMGFTQVPFGVSDFCLPGIFGPEATGDFNRRFSDRQIIQVLAAPPEKQKRLLETARRLPEILLNANDTPLANSAELYGSLALMTESTRWRDQDWPVCYVNGQSDVDFVVDMRKDVAPYAIVSRLLRKDTWKLVGQVQVHKFSSTQFTLLGSFEADGESNENEVYLDLTCIENPTQFRRFKKRQEAFRKVFLQVRSHLEATFAEQGVIAFDAYIHLLKAFAAKVPQNAISVYQATCIGLFTLRIGHFRLKQSLSLALCFFEGFLRFCYQFYSDTETPCTIGDTALGYRRQSIDLSAGRLLPRQNPSWRSELYFRGVEAKQPDEWMNVTHSLDPLQVSMEALELLERSFPVCAEDAYSFGMPSPDGWLFDSSF